MADKRPTPYNLVVVTEGVNQTLQFKSETSGRSALTATEKAFNEGTALRLVDDYDTVMGVKAGGIRSYRLYAIMSEHRANMQLKLAELYAALEFEELVNTEHMTLKMIRARNPSTILKPS